MGRRSASAINRKHVTVNALLAYDMLTKYIPIRFGLVKARRVIHLNQKPLLTKREREVFELLLQDKTTKEIASELFISEKTVRNHISNAMQKLGVKGRSQAVVELLRMGELEL